MLSYSVRARRIDSHGAIASARAAELLLDTDVQGRDDAFNPAELFLEVQGIEGNTQPISDASRVGGVAGAAAALLMAWPRRQNRQRASRDRRRACGVRRFAMAHEQSDHLMPSALKERSSSKCSSS